MQLQNRAVLFDLYDTLVEIQVDESSARLWNAVKRALGAASSPRELRLDYEALGDVFGGGDFGGSVLEAIFTALIEKHARVDLSVEELAAVFRRASRTRLRLRPFALPLIAEVRRRGYRTGIVSNTEALVTRVDLADLNMEDLVDVVVLSSDVGAEKPDRLPFDTALRTLGVDPSNALFFGDNFDVDVEGAISAGMCAVLVTLAKRNHKPNRGFLGSSRPIQTEALSRIDEFEQLRAA